MIATTSDHGFRDGGLNRPWRLNHALRTTFGRTLFRRHVPVEKIAEPIAHEDRRTPMRYLGMSDDDWLAAMRVIDQLFG